MKIQGLYAIVDRSSFTSTDELLDYARDLVSSGVRLIQYRNKCGSAREMLSDARELRRTLGTQALLIMNDRADLAVAAGFDGVHVGQDDLSVDAVRSVIGTDLIVGLSTHNPEQVAEADKLPVTYIAVGPVFATSSKVNPDPVIGVGGVRRARELTDRSLVAIGGITRANVAQVVSAGADAVAVISDLRKEPKVAVREFLKSLT